MTEPPPRKPRSSQQAFALFAYGFRPFFWAAGVFATLGLIEKRSVAEIDRYVEILKA